MGTSGSGGRGERPHLATTIAILAALCLGACTGVTPATTDTPTSPLLAIAGGPSARPPSPTPKVAPTPAPKPLACRGSIPSSISALEGPLRGPVGPTTTATLWYVVDGDTIRLTNKDYVRLIGMDTPETVDPNKPVQPYGPQASADAKALLAGHTTVTLEQDVSNTDYYGRLLRFVWIKSGSRWLQLDYELVVRGDARLDTVRPDVRYEADYASAERVAESHHVGRWATC